MTSRAGQRPQWLVPILALLALISGPAAPAAAAPPALTVPALGHFRSVLAQGEGQTINGADLLAYEASSQPPDSFVNQQPLYVGVMPAARTLRPGDLNTYYKDTAFGSMPGGIASTETPHPGVQIFRDGSFGMAHVYGANRYDVMFGAGYASAEERLFLMDALRRTAKGTLAGLTGPSAANGDGDQLTDQDFSDQELTAQFNAMPQKFGAEGQQARSDILAYIDGINMRINEDNADPSKLPAEYAALGTTPAPWTPSDSAAMATLLVTQFTVSNGGEERGALMQEAFRKHFGRGWHAPYHDLREENDPEAYTVAKRPFISDTPGPVKKGLNAMPDFDSIVRRNAFVSESRTARNAGQSSNLPSWVQSVNGLRKALPPVESNAVLVSPKLSADGHALAGMGPQVGYYSPQIFVEYELHGGGIDGEGVSFPGASPYPLIGHGIDFAWTGTSANGDNEDTFAEKLCNPDGSAPTQASTHYRYKGRCVPFLMRDQVVHTPVSPLDPTTPSKTITYRTMRSVHGPVFAFATVAGRAIALTKAKAVDFHELDAVIPFMRLAENQPTGPRSFVSTMGKFPGTENWFYVDHRHIAFIQSGRYPRHAPGSNLDRPYWGSGKADWQNFHPSTYTFRAIPASHRPQSIDPKDGFLTSWNNKEAIGWRKGPTEWSNGPVHRAMILQNRLFDQARAHHASVDLTGLTRAVNLAATTDLRGEDLYPWMRRVIGQAHGQSARMLKILDAWHRSGANRLDANGDNVYDHSAAVALMDAWWPRAVRAEFTPGLGQSLFDLVESRMLGLGGDFGWDWGSQVQKDLRSVLGRPEKGRYSRIYCGGPVAEPASAAQLADARIGCRAVLLKTLRQAVADVKGRLGNDPSQWKVYALCGSGCDQIEPNTAGAVDTPPFPWQNRGTFHQIDEIVGHR